MSNCKYCGAEIDWIKIDGKNKPLNTDKTQHSCKKDAAETTTQGKTAAPAMSPAELIQFKMSSLKAFMELTKGVDPELIPACASVWNNTK